MFHPPRRRDFPVNLIIKEILSQTLTQERTNSYSKKGQTGIGMKDRYLMLIFKIVLLESSEVETDSQMTDGQKIVQTDGQKIVQTETIY